MSDEVRVPPEPSPSPEPSPPTGRPRFGEGGFAGLTLLAVVLAYFSVGAVTQMLNVAFGVWFTEVEIFFGIPWVLARAFRRDPLREHGLPFPGWTAALLGLLLGAVNLVTVVFPLQAFSQTVVPQWLKEHSVDVVQIFSHQTRIELAFLFAAVGVVAPICEEFFFRGTFQKSLIARSGRVLWPIALTATLFSLLHMDAVGFLARAELGVLFGVLAWRTGSIWPGVFAHAANNLVSTALYFALSGAGDPESDAVDPSSLKYMAVLLAVGIPVVLALGRRAIAVAQTPAPPARIPEEPPPFWGTVAPWILGGLIALVGLGLVDRRGIELNVRDFTVELPAEGRTADPAEKQIRQALERTRADARAGRIPVEQYLQQRRQAQVQLQALAQHADQEKGPEEKLPPGPAPVPTPGPGR